MKEIRVYDMICPIWLLLLIPPLIFLSLAANFVIDSIVLILSYLIFRVGARTQIGAKKFYLSNIVKVWLLGFTADLVGAAVVILLCLLFGALSSVPSLTDSALLRDSYYGACIVGMLVAAAVIYLLNYFGAFRKSIPDKPLRRTLSLTFAIITMPWTFLIQYYPG